MNREGYCDPTAEKALRNVEYEERRLYFMSSFGKCRNCGKQIVWIRTKAGKSMPCNPNLVSYRLPKDGEKGKERLVLENGEVISAVEVSSDEAEGTGYISHFSTCRNVVSSRKR